jgi:hypothetical protein
MNLRTRVPAAVCARVLAGTIYSQHTQQLNVEVVCVPFMHGLREKAKQKERT